MISKLLFLSIVTVVLSAEAEPDRAPQEPTAEALVPPLHAKFQAAFSKQGFTPEQIDKIELQFYREGIDRKRWPFTDEAVELVHSITNRANANAGKVATAIEKAGGDPTDVSSLTPAVCMRARSFAKNEPAVGDPSSTQSLLQSAAGSSLGDPSSIYYMGRGLSMSAGSVASNSATLSSLRNMVLTDIVATGEISSAVASLSQVTGPTSMLAAATGIPISTVSSMALAGSFLGPLLGVVAIVYAAWPNEDADPWLQVESRVAHMINDKFDAKRRFRLGNRLRRYVKEFSRCAQAWAADGLVNVNDISLPRHIYAAAIEAQSIGNLTGGFFELDIKKGATLYPAPRCAARLEALMSIERDEWFKTDSGQMSALFMPFANMHTQVLSMLTDHPFDEDMKWGASLQVTAAEYADFTLSHLLTAWMAQVCTSMRLRQSLKDGPWRKWRYVFVVYTAVIQPNAAKDCSDQCGEQIGQDHKSGWCNWCGGIGNGACCKKGDGGVCASLDTPVGWLGIPYAACVHTDCIQENTGYYGTILRTFQQPDDGEPHWPEGCRLLCINVHDAVAFTLTDGGRKCFCTAQHRLKRHYEKDAYSGLTLCKQFKDPERERQELEDRHGDNLGYYAKVPMKATEVCEKSPMVANYEELENYHMYWVLNCYAKAAEMMVVEYNEFYLHFAQFVDMLAWKAGCGTSHETPWVYNGKDGNGFERVSNSFDGGTFATCNWERQEVHDQNMWVFDEKQARGWSRTSKTSMEEQSKARQQYPLPAWLHDLADVHTCLKGTNAGEVANRNSGASAAISESLEPAQLCHRCTAGTDSIDERYEILLREAEAEAEAEAATR